LSKVFEGFNEKKLYRVAFVLAVITILYNTIEGLVSVYFGYEDKSLNLFGFGIDSFIETLSGIGIFHMITRISKLGLERRDEFERTALRITGTAFYMLSAGLTAAAILRVMNKTQPETTIWGVVISIISILSMLVLFYAKLETGKALNSAPIIADAHCTKVCIYMSVVLLAASGLYELFHLPYIDAIGTAGLVYFSFNEAKECFFKARTDEHCGCGHD
jgi:divalent metal cation (Fe/Co/Zn/Cd) transporter